MDKKELKKIFKQKSSPYTSITGNSHKVLFEREFVVVVDQLINSQWIKCSDELPKDIPKHRGSEDILVCNNSKNWWITIAYYSYNLKKWLRCYDSEEVFWNITHWQPLPQPPKDKSGKVI